jgi:23S rRNA pseudouridine2457 synthase
MSEMAYQHYKVYKPYGMLSQLTSNEERQLRKKRFLSELFDFPEGSMPIGRLDEKSEGLLLMTTDGKLSDEINQSGVEKEYYAQLDGEITDKAIDQLRMGVEIGLFGKRYVTKPSKVNRLLELPNLPKADKKIRIDTHRPNSWISITLTEGKFRQVRKMTAAVGFPTLRLVRIRIGNMQLDDTTVGRVTPITHFDL